jgi:hypothetical protein
MKFGEIVDDLTNCPHSQNTCTAVKYSPAFLYSPEKQNRKSERSNIFRVIAYDLKF